MSKATVKVGYTGTTLDNYKTWKRKSLTGADVTLTDGKGNTIEVNIRGGKDGYRISLNGKTISIA